MQGVGFSVVGRAVAGVGRGVPHSFADRLVRPPPPVANVRRTVAGRGVPLFEQLIRVSRPADGTGTTIYHRHSPVQY